MHGLLQRFVSWPDHRRVLRELNGALVGMGLEAITTAATCTYYPPTRTLTYSYAGHPPGWIYRAAKGRWSRLDGSPGTADGGGLTSVGDDNVFMNHVHVAHDCHVGSHVIMSNSVGLAGHVRVEDYAVLGAMSGVHQFVRIGESAMLGAFSGVGQDLAPFTIAHGIPARLVAVNKINVERRGFPKERTQQIERAFRIIFRSGLRPRGR